MGPGGSLAAPGPQPVQPLLPWMNGGLAAVSCCLWGFLGPCGGMTGSVCPSCVLAGLGFGVRSGCRGGTELWVMSACLLKPGDGAWGPG